MRFVLLLVFLAALTAFQLAEGTGKPYSVPKEDIAKIIDRHNYWRLDVGVGPLQWSDEMADIAEQWAKELKKDGCGFYHSDYGFGKPLERHYGLVLRGRCY